MTALYIVRALKASLNSTWSTTDNASVSSLVSDRIVKKEPIVPNVATKAKWHRPMAQTPKPMPIGRLSSGRKERDFSTMRNPQHHTLCLKTVISDLGADERLN